MDEREELLGERKGWVWGLREGVLRGKKGVVTVEGALGGWWMVGKQVERVGRL